MSRSKKLYILLGILAAACAATFAVTRLEERKEQIKTSSEMILELSSESVQSLSWEYNGETLAFHRDEIWFYDGDENFPVSEEKIRGLLEPFQAFGAAFVIEDVEDFGQYGLDDPVCTIELSTAEQTYAIKLGNYSKMDAQRYVSIGDGNVYLAKHDPLDEYGAVLPDMIAHDEIPAFDRVTQIQFTGPETYRITYQETSTDSYSAGDLYFAQQGGKNLPLDTSKVNDYLWSITDLSLTDYVSYHAADGELQAYGLDAPEWTITVNYITEETADTFTLYVSPNPEDIKAAGETAESDSDTEISAYIRVGESQIVYKISPSNYKKLTAASYDDLRHTEVIWADFSDIQQIDIALEGNIYTLAAQQDGTVRTWLYQEAAVETAALQNRLENLSAVEFTSEQPAQKEEIRLTVHLDNEHFPKIQIALYRYDGTRCLAVVDDKSVSLLDRACVVDLIEAVHAIVLN